MFVEGRIGARRRRVAVSSSVAPPPVALGQRVLPAGMTHFSGETQPGPLPMPKNDAHPVAVPLVAGNPTTQMVAADAMVEVDTDPPLHGNPLLRLVEGPGPTLS